MQAPLTLYRLGGGKGGRRYTPPKGQVAGGGWTQFAPPQSRGNRYLAAANCVLPLLEMDYFAWRATGKPVEVRLNLPMLRYMGTWLNERSQREPEAFGILLGKVRHRWGKYRLWVEDFDPFDPATLRGSPKAPRGSELEIVGLYRRRRGRLKLDQLDASLIETSFTNPGMVYLLIAPEASGPDRATFFVQEHGEVHGYAAAGEFPWAPDLLRRPAARVAKWLPVAGLLASLVALAGWFLWLRWQAAPRAVQPAAPLVEQPKSEITKPRAAELTQAATAGSSDRPTKRSRRRAARRRR